MDETRRVAYLDAMGVQAVYPRRALAAARPSPVYRIPQPADQEGDDYRAGKALTGEEPRREQEVEEKVEQKREQKREQEREQESAKQIGQEPILTVAPAPPPAAPAAARDGDELRFKLHYYPIDGRLAVIDELPHQGDGSVLPETLHLLRNILAALGIDSGGRDFEQESLEWPLAHGPGTAGASQRAAQQALKGFITKRRQQDGFANLLVFAAQVGPLLQGDAGDTAAADFQSADQDCRITVTRSLQAMLAYPALKKDVWRELQPLRRRLQS